MQLDDQTRVHRLLPSGAFTTLAYDPTLGFLKQFAIILRRPGHVASDIGQLFQPGSQLAYTGDKLQQQNPGPNQLEKGRPLDHISNGYPYILSFIMVLSR